jgi:hypothetical protein
VDTRASYRDSGSLSVAARWHSGYSLRMITNRVALGLVAVSFALGCDALGIGKKKEEPAGAPALTASAAAPATPPATAAATTATASAAADAPLDPFVKRHLEILLTAAECGTAPLEPWCMAAKGFASARPAPVKHGTLLGVATFVQTDGASRATLAKYTKTASFSTRSGAPSHALIADVKGDNPSEEAELTTLRGQIFDHFAGKQVTFSTSAPLVGYLGSLVERAKYPMNPTPNGYKLEGGSNADVRKVGAAWVAVEVPARNPAGIWFNVFTEKSYAP